jgi:hypothetical protein
MSVTLQRATPLFAYLSLNYLLYVLRPLLCFNPFKFLSFLFLSYLFYVLLSFFVCVYLWSVLFPLMYITVLAFCVQCKVHCHRLETHLQYTNIVSYRKNEGNQTVLLCRAVIVRIWAAVFFLTENEFGLFRWPCDLRLGSAAARMQGSRVPISLRA